MCFQRSSTVGVSYLSVKLFTMHDMGFEHLIYY